MTAWVAFLPLLLTACGPQYVFEEEKDLPEAGWTYRDTVEFKFEITDTTRVYNLYMDFEHVDTFAFQNLYLRLSTLFPDGTRLSRVRSFDLYNAQGESNGSCSGRTCSVQMVLQQNAFFKQPGTYVLTLEQFGRRDTLPGVGSVGLAVEAVDRQ
jgi:gliding motility-associated lipoprotein GldH